MTVLSDTKAKNTKPGDRPVADGTVSGLRLHPGQEKGHGKWLLRYKSPTVFKGDKRKEIKKPPELARRDMGLGTYPEVSLTEARTAALAARELIRSGVDPIEARKANTQALQRDAQALTFEKAAREVHEVCDTPLTFQIEALMRCLPPVQRDRPWSMEELVARLSGRFTARPHPMHVGQALWALGWTTRRDWTRDGGGRRMWLRPNAD